MKFVPDRYDEGVDDARLTLRAWLSGNQRMLFGDDGAVMWAWCLAANLATAGGLCAAYWHGYDVAKDRARFWEPGCHRPAPWWGDK